MAITTTPRIALPQWGLGSDGPSRTQFNTAFANIEARAAYDDGAVGDTTLPISNVVDGRYAQTVDGSYRRLYRRAGGAWSQVGGNTWSETQYRRADGALATSADATVLSHPTLASPSATERWDGTSIRGARQAIGDLNAGLPGALHVGDTTSAVDLAVRGRVYARTTATGQRGFVASAHAATAGNLFSAIESGGTVPWLIDASGRMRAQAPAAFGGGALTTNVPLVSAPGASDLTAADLYAASGKPALRVYRASGDATPIALFEQDKITLGRASWTGGRVDMLGPGLYVAGTIEVDGLTDLDGALSVAGATTLAGLTAGASTLGNTTVGTLAASGRTDINNDLYVTGRVDLPTNQPSGTSTGQIRISTDWVLEIFDGTNWRRAFGTVGGTANSTGRKHSWFQSGGALGGGDVYTTMTGLPSGNGGGSIASMSSGVLTLSRPGLWVITASAFIDHGVEGLNRLRMNWPSGAIPGRDALYDIRKRSITFGHAASGNGEGTLTWAGYVTQAQASQGITFAAAQRAADGSTTTATAYTVTAEWLSY